MMLFMKWFKEYFCPNITNEKNIGTTNEEPIFEIQWYDDTRSKIAQWFKEYDDPNNIIFMDEFDSRLDLNVEFLLCMSPDEQKKYIATIGKLRHIAHTHNL